MLSLPMRVTPSSWVVPRLTVQHSRNTLRSPISRRVGSPRYFLSWGASPIEANWKMTLSAPIVVGPLMTACAATRVRGPRRTCGPMTANGPTVTSAASSAWGEMTARSSITTRLPVPAPQDGLVIVPGASISSAEAASASPTDATADIFQMPRRVRSSVALSVSWSPGSTGRRKRALSMPTK